MPSGGWEKAEIKDRDSENEKGKKLGSLQFSSGWCVVEEKTIFPTSKSSALLGLALPCHVYFADKRRKLKEIGRVMASVKVLSFRYRSELGGVRRPAK